MFWTCSWWVFHKYNISQVMVRRRLDIGIEIVLCWFSLLSLFIIPLSYLKVTHPNCWFEPNYDYFIWNNHGAKKLAFLSEVSFTLIKFAPRKLSKRKWYLALQIHFSLFLWIHLISSSSSYSPLTNFLLQISCSKNSLNS